MALADIQAGKPVISHNGEIFTAGIDEGAQCTTIKIVIPSKAGTSYELRKWSPSPRHGIVRTHFFLVQRPVDQAIHLKRVTRTRFEESAQVAPTPVATSLPKAQPKGMRARYAPPGVGDALVGEIGIDASDNEDVEMAEPAPAAPSTGPTNTPKPRSTKKRKLEAETPGQDKATPASTKKTKKAKVDATPAASSKKAVKQTPVAAPPLPSSQLNGSVKRTPIPPPPIPGMKRP